MQIKAVNGMSVWSDNRYDKSKGQISLAATEHSDRYIFSSPHLRNMQLILLFYGNPKDIS